MTLKPSRRGFGIDSERMFVHAIALKMTAEAIMGFAHDERRVVFFVAHPSHRPIARMFSPVLPPGDGLALGRRASSDQTAWKSRPARPLK